MDWDKRGRVELVQLVNASTGSVLDTETLSSFGGGKYLQWVITGSVQINVFSLAGANAVVSGVFLDGRCSPRARPLVKSDSTTQGNWIGAYGTKGYDIEGQPTSLPSYAGVSFAGRVTPYTWASSTTDPRALQTPGGSGRAATTWYSASSFTIDVNLTDSPGAPAGRSTRVDWDKVGRERAGPVDRRDDGDGARHRDALVVRRRHLPAVARQRARADQGQPHLRGQCRRQRPVPRSDPDAARPIRGAVFGDGGSGGRARAAGPGLPRGAAGRSPSPALMRLDSGPAAGETMCSLCRPVAALAGMDGPSDVPGRLAGRDLRRWERPDRCPIPCEWA